MNYVGREPAPSGLILVGDTNPIGAIAFFHAPPDASWQRLNGQVLLKAAFPDLWAYAQGFLTLDQVANPGLYKDVSGTTFGVPKLDGLFIRGAGQVDANHAAAALGVKQADGNLSHIHGQNSDDCGVSGTGAGMAKPWSGRGVIYTGINTNADGGTEARPVNVALVPCVKALRTVLIPQSAMPVPPAVTINQTAILGPVAAAGAFKEITGIPATAKRVTVGFSQVSLDAAESFGIRVGPAAGVVAAGYYSDGGYTSMSAPGGYHVADRFPMVTAGGWPAVHIWQGHCLLTLVDASTNTWAASWNVASYTGSVSYSATGAGDVSLVGPLERVRLIPQAAANFDGGKFSVLVDY